MVTIAASRSGYLGKSEPVSIPAGQNSVNVTITLVRQGTVYGKVVDEYGDPFGRSNVMLFRRVYDNGWRWQQLNDALAGPDGTYMLGELTPGRYLLSASDNMSTSRTDSPTRYLQTYYPNASEPSGATPIEILPESELRGIDIRMRKGRVFRVSGKVMSGGAENVQQVNVRLVSRDVTLMNGQDADVAKDGTFAMQGVPEGAYYAVVQGQIRAAGNASAIMLTGREPVTVSSRDVDNVVIQLVSGMEISGRVRIDGVLPQPQPAGGPGQAPRVTLRSPEPNAPVSNTQSKPDGTFTIKNIAPGSYRVEASGPPGTYVANVRYDNEDVTRGLITLEKRGGTMDIVFKTDSAHLTGVARDDRGDPLAETRVSIWSSNAKGGFAATALTDRMGVFLFQNVPPGDYRVAAWDSKGAQPVFGTVLRAMDFLRQFDSSASSIRLESSGQQSQDVKMIPQAAMEAALARLP